jgi:hypothetical protein
MFDIETMGKESTSVVLSIACIHFDPDTDFTYQELKDSAFFVKLNAKDQIQRLNRVVRKDSLQWWEKQCENAKRMSLYPHGNDMRAEDALEKLRQWSLQKDPSQKEWVFARGNLDQLVIESLTDRIGVEQVFLFPRWRDVRTAIDFLYGTGNGYCKVEKEGFDPYIDVTKHDPIDDCAFDIMMLKYGIGE